MKWLWLGIAAYVAFVAALVVWATGHIDPAHLARVPYTAHPANAADAQDPAVVAGLLRRAQAGDADAQLRVGQAYALGRGLRQDDAQAAAWYARSAAQGNAAAQARLGWAYYAGAGVPQDAVKAATWLELASAQGDPAAASLRARVEHALTPAQRSATAQAVRAWRAEHSVH